MSHTYIIAEIGPNHNGSVETAIEMIDKLSKTGIDAIKFQLTDPYKLYSKDAFKPKYQIENDPAKDPITMSLKYQLKPEAHFRLHQRCVEVGVDYICTAFDLESLTFLYENFKLPYFKIASGEIFSIDMIEYISRRNTPIILSTGMASFDEIGLSLSLLDPAGTHDITILHCISSYPAEPEDVNLNVIPELRKRFGRNVGLSDHSVGNEAAIASVAMGGCMIEKHVTMDKTWQGPDHKASASIEDFADLVKSVRKVEKMMGTSEKVFSDKEIEIKKAGRKSIIAKEDLPAGHIITEEDICFKRPGTGILPINKSEVIGKRLIAPASKDRIITPMQLEK